MQVMQDRRDGRPQEVVGTFARYAEAQEAVDHLSDQQFPVENTTIVGRDLSLVERVTGRRGYVQAAGQGAASGAFLGVFLGFVVGVFSLVDPLVSGLALALYGLVIGVVAGAVVGLISHALSGGKRDFSSVGTIEADHFDVLCVASRADEARRALERR